MKKVTIKPNQSKLDMVLMSCGTMEAAMQVMAANEQSITGSAAPGSEYTIPVQATTDNNTLAYLQQNKIDIGTRG